MIQFCRPLRHIINVRHIDVAFRAAIPRDLDIVSPTRESSHAHKAFLNAPSRVFDCDSKYTLSLRAKKSEEAAEEPSVTRFLKLKTALRSPFFQDLPLRSDAMAVRAYAHDTCSPAEDSKHRQCDEVALVGLHYVKYGRQGTSRSNGLDYSGGNSIPATRGNVRRMLTMSTTAPMRGGVWKSQVDYGETS